MSCLPTFSSFHVVQWFTSPQTFDAPISWCTGDESDDEDSDDEDDCWLRAGSYAGTMTSEDGRTRPVSLKLRMDEDEETKLYERFYNDEYLGWSTKGAPDKSEPLGLYKYAGSVNNEAKTITLVKSYVAGNDATSGNQNRTKAMAGSYTGDLSSKNICFYDLFKFEGSAGDGPNTIKGKYDIANSQLCSGKYDDELTALLTKLQIGKSGTFEMHKVEKKTG